MVQGTQVHLQTQADEVHEGYEAAGHVEIKTVLGKPRETWIFLGFSAICWFWIVFGKLVWDDIMFFCGTKINSDIYREPHDGIPIPKTNYSRTPPRRNLNSMRKL